MTWREMHDFSPDCVLVVLADSHYDESDYYRQLRRFLRAAQAAAKEVLNAHCCPCLRNNAVARAKRCHKTLVSVTVCGPGGPQH